MLNQTSQEKFECANITAEKEGRVYCYRLQDWIDSVNCHCSAETRSAEATQEW